jgi:hypothetical protein
MSDALVAILAWCLTMAIWAGLGWYLTRPPRRHRQDLWE